MPPWIPGSSTRWSAQSRRLERSRHLASEYLKLRKERFNSRDVLADAARVSGDSPSGKSNFYQWGVWHNSRLSRLPAPVALGPAQVTRRDIITRITCWETWRNAWQVRSNITRCFIQVFAVSFWLRSLYMQMQAGERHKLNKFISSLIMSGQTYNVLNKRNYPVRIRVYNSALIPIRKKLFIVAYLHVITWISVYVYVCVCIYIYCTTW